ncbi:hypothetical protein LEN26_001175 [Aphanomyces euteiches]|uniref:FYVE-type domain-containing protein n=1 Tax=Aphanomyces euteiches TaxID=100861 RepID=A0A6G0WGK5_9STRA|nr:hypothetical protein Ae201684_015394 [Aphanomyces euteiches]KAH9097704.1 hypothetical protein Ae201684P_001180 [Aphanomyces euteiches]KAH9127169.1 hypothetical protein AeMF1_002508 [Aphanomyces euteiches]KAH9155303.1 hypothetical protein AeRB84_002725 [Aphanomyces euteiches]KAH9161974.1 hypothetical protein LEN26_001175 [Aphanomyces euteiches]
MTGRQAENSPKRIALQIPMSPPNSAVSAGTYSVGSSTTSSNVIAREDLSSATECTACHDAFSIFKKRYLCPYCGDAVCRKCSKSMKKVKKTRDESNIPRLSSAPTSPISMSTEIMDFDDTSSIASSTASTVNSSSHRGVRERCCKNCAAFAPATKAPSKCEVCKSTAAVFRKKVQCQVCQKFACKACGELKDGVPFGIQSEAKVWICVTCSKAHEKQKIKSQLFCHICKAKFAEFQRRCQCKTCGTTTCMQCSVSVEKSADQKLDVRECRKCDQASRETAIAAAPVSRGMFHLTSPFEFSKDKSSSFAAAMGTWERSCASALVAIGLTVVVCAILLAYFYFVASVVEESWISDWYKRHPSDL